MLIGYKIGAAFILLGGVVLGSGAIGSFLPMTENEAISTADRLTVLENDLARLGEENKRLSAELDDIIRQCNDHFEYLNKYYEYHNKYNEVLRKHSEEALTARLNLENVVYELAKSQAISASLVKWLIAGASTRDGDGFFLRSAGVFVERTDESFRQINDILDDERRRVGLPLKN